MTDRIILSGKIGFEPENKTDFCFLNTFIEDTSKKSILSKIRIE
jgi:hypothetical protein